MARIVPVLLVIFAACVTNTQAAVQTKVVTYKDGDLECRGFLAWDDSQSEKRPGVLIVHEWWGLNDYARDRAKELAKSGYVAFAADMYGEGKTTEHPQEASQMAAHVRMNVDAWRKRAMTALKVLADQPSCDKTNLAAIGYCFGGSTALQLAFSGADLKAVASFHGALPAPSEKDAKAVKAKVLICHGAADKFIPDDAIKSFRGALDKAGSDYEFVAYPGVVHSFTVPDADKHNNPGMKYDAQAAADSWKRLMTLLKEQLH